MQEPTQCSLETFWLKLQNVSQRTLALDYDGTLAPFHQERDKAFPYPGVREILEKIQQSGRTRLIIVSGRAVADLLPLLGLKSIPEIWGSHGFERRLPDGTMTEQGIDPESLQHLESAYNWILNNGYENYCEKKPASIAFHWRGTKKNLQSQLEKIIHSNWSPYTRNGKLQIHPFDGGLELRCTEKNKGDAIKQILEESADDALLAYLGDDLTDEDAYKVLKGKGLSVLVRTTPRDTLADCWLNPPDDLLDFLEKWHSFSL